MARPQKIGLDYFPLNVDIDRDDKIALIEAQHGMVGFAIAVKLLMKIYSEGYYYDWTEKEQILFSKRINLDINKLNIVIDDCVKWGLFNEDLFNKYKIITSRGIQLRYFEAVKRRKKVEIAKQHIMLTNDDINLYTNIVIVDINEQGEIVNVDINPQRKEKESKEKESKEKESILNKTTTEEKRAGSGSSSKDIGLDENISKIALSFQNNGFGSINGTVKEMIIELLDSYSMEWILEAMKVAVEANKRSLRYVRGVLENWNRSGGMKLSTDKNSNDKYKPKIATAAKTRFHNFESRTDKYSAEQIEDIATKKRREHVARMKANSLNKAIGGTTND